LKNVDLRVPPGQFIFIIGTSGAGKTSLLWLLFATEAS
jgi:ABC-type ATPase involved in cell division